MPLADEKIKRLSETWNNLIEKELGQDIDEQELSSLSSWVIDCYEGYKEIYTEQLEKIRTASLDDYDLIHDCVFDIYWQLDHIKKHINESEKGFAKLMRKLAREDE